MMKKLKILNFLLMLLFIISGSTLISSTKGNYSMHIEKTIIKVPTSHPGIKLVITIYENYPFGPDNMGGGGTGNTPVTSVPSEGGYSSHVEGTSSHPAAFMIKSGIISVSPSFVSCQDASIVVPSPAGPITLTIADGVYR